MLTIIQKISITALFIGCTLLPMDPPGENQTKPISIATLCDHNIYYFTNALNAIDANLEKLKIEGNLKQKTEKQKMEIQQLLELNQTFKQQWQNKIQKTRQELLAMNDTRKIEDFSRQQDKFKTETSKNEIANLLEELPQNMDRAIDRGVEQAQKKIAQDVNEILRDSDQRIHDILKTTGLPTTTNESTISREDREKMNRFGYCMCAGIITLIISTVYITKYFFPQ